MVFPPFSMTCGRHTWAQKEFYEKLHNFYLKKWSKSIFRLVVVVNEVAHWLIFSLVDVLIGKRKKTYWLLFARDAVTYSCPKKKNIFLTRRLFLFHSAWMAPLAPGGNLKSKVVAQTGTLAPNFLVYCKTKLKLKINFSKWSTSCTSKS